MIIFLVGFMGSGKTYQARKLSERLNVPWYDLDELIEKSEEKTIVAIFEKFGENGFREIEQRVLRKLVSEIEISQANSAIVACGGGTPCFYDNMQFMNGRGITIWLNPSKETIFERLISEKENRPLIKSIVDPDLKEFIETKLVERKQCYEGARLQIRENEPVTEDLLMLIHHAKKLP